LPSEAKDLAKKPCQDKIFRVIFQSWQKHKEKKNEKIVETE